MSNFAHKFIDIICSIDFFYFKQRWCIFRFLVLDVFNFFIVFKIVTKIIFVTKWSQILLRQFQMHLLLSLADKLWFLFCNNVVVFLQHFLQSISVSIIIFVQLKYFEGLLFCHESTLDSKSFFSNLFSAFVSEFFATCLLTLFDEEFENFLLSLMDCERSYHVIFLLVFFLFFKLSIRIF